MITIVKGNWNFSALIRLMIKTLKRPSMQQLGNQKAKSNAAHSDETFDT